MANKDLSVNKQIAIYEHSQPMIVSASAGSGKTFAMVKRAISILEDKKATINELLIVTFTNASALEMKQRLLSTIKASDSTILRQQLKEFSLADISSIDSFCQKVIKRYFYEINISPNFSVIDEMEANYYKNQAMTKTFNELQKLKDKDFEIIVEILTKKRELKQLSTQILNITNFANTLNDKETFYDKFAISNYNSDFSNNSCVKFLDNCLKNDLNHISKLLSNLLPTTDKNLEIFIPIINNVINAINQTKELPIEQKLQSIDYLKNVYVLPNAKTLKLESQKEFNNILKTIKDQYVKILSQFYNDFSDGDLHFVREKIDSAKNVVNCFIKIIKKYETIYEKIKQEKFVLDYADLERKALQILQNEQICDDVAKRYKYLFIDEFQDTNELQFNILSKLTKYAIPFYVGDEKQSIYAFRNSSPDIMQGIFNHYKNNSSLNKALNFSENYRSDKAILNFANYLFSAIMKKDTVGIDYDKEGKFNLEGLESSQTTAIPKVFIGISSKEKEEKETEFLEEVYSVKKNQDIKSDFSQQTDWTDLIINYIKSFFDEKIEIFDKITKSNRLVVFSDFCILLRNSSSFDDIVQKLSLYNIPVSVSLKLNLFDSLEVKTLHNFLLLLSNSFDDIVLTNFLLSRLGNMTEEELLLIKMSYPQEQYFYKAVYKYADEQKNDISEKIKKILKIIDYFKLKLEIKSISDVLYDVLNYFDLENFWLSKPNGVNRMDKVIHYINVLQTKSFNNSLSEYVDFVEKYPDAFTINYSTTSDDNSIKIMTIHHSKGLEFPIVILGDFGKDFIKQKKDEVMKDSDFGIALDFYNLSDRTRSQTIIKSAIHKSKRLSEIKEEMRLFYVAITRAINYVGIFGDYNFKDFDKEMLVFNILSAKNYLEWLLFVFKDLFNPLIYTIQSTIENVSFQLFNKTPLKIEQLNISQVIDVNNDDKKLKQSLQTNLVQAYKYTDSIGLNLKNSVSRLLSSNNSNKEIVDARLEFINDNIYNINLLETSERGIAYHKAMELMDFSSSNIANELENIKNNINEKNYTYLDENLLKSAFLSLCEMCLNALKVYKEKKFMLYIPYNQIITDSTITDKVLVQGIIDVFIEKTDRIILVDYKTNITKDENKLKEKYTLQLQIYKKALEKQFKKPVKSYLYSFSLSKFIEI